MTLRDRRLRLAVVLVLLLSLSAAWLVLDRVRQPGTATVVPQAQAAARPSATPGEVAVEPEPSATALSAIASAPKAAGQAPAAEARRGEVSGSRSRPGLPALAAQAGTMLAGGSALSDVVQDQGAGVPLPNGETLWIFADTTQVKRTPYFFVTSSGGVTTRGSHTLQYASDGEGLPIEFLPRNADEKVGQQNGQRYNAVWPTGATKLPDGRIIIGYAKYDVIVASNTFNFLGAGLYEYRYPGRSKLKDAAPANRIAQLWSMTDGAVGSPLYAGGYVYFTQCESLQCFSVRTPVSGLTDRGSYAWFTGSGWSHDRADRKPMSYGDNGRPGRNPSTVHLPEQGVYAAVDTMAGAASGTAQLWVAANPWGPWSRPAAVPMPQCPAAGCYTLNLHTNQSPPGAIRISYATHGVGPYVRVSDYAISVSGTGSAVTARLL